MNVYRLVIIVWCWCSVLSRLVQCSSSHIRTHGTGKTAEAVGTHLLTEVRRTNSLIVIVVPSYTAASNQKSSDPHVAI